MKPKDIGLLAIAVVILAGAGYVIYSQLTPRKAAQAASTTMVEIAPVVPSSFDDSAMKTLTDATKARDFTPSIDLTQGLGNTSLFGQ